MAVTTRLTWNEEKSLQKLLGNVSLTLLYKSRVHGRSTEEMVNRCCRQGSTLTVVYLPNHIVGAFICGQYPEMCEDSGNQTSSLYFSIKNNKTAITEFLNAAPKITSEKLIFYSSSHEELFSLTPEDFTVYIHTLLRNKLQLNYPERSECLEYEVFRVEGIEDGGYINRIAGAIQHRKRLLEDLRAYRPYGDLTSEVRILLLGPVGSGKSSFFNSVKSVFHGHMTCQAAVGSDTTRTTELYRIYSIKDGKDGESLPFKLCDSMGLDEREGAGLCMDDIPHILKGCMPDRYHFSSQQPITSKHPTFIMSPSLKDRIHCVAYVFSSDSISSLSSEMVEKFKLIQKEVLNCGVPQVALLTKVKNYHEVLQDNFLNMKQSMTSKSEVIKVQKMLNIPIFNIMMVENYASEWELDPLKDVLILSVLKQILRAIDDFLEDLPLEKTDKVVGMSQLYMVD
ncbi:interferon-induced protein 44-like [Saccopteryx bilineata]|uniref:interferon-induced protein 44-like n=1 Tax=Saccopteryx bilineata TaxID=59482 RepID=UPI00338FF7E5